MRNRFDEQLNTLNNELITMGALCEEAISSAVKLLIDNRDLLAEMKNYARAKGESFTQHNVSNILRELIES